MGDYNKKMREIHGAPFKFTGYLIKAKSGLLQNSLKGVLGEKILPQYDI